MKILLTSVHVQDPIKAFAFYTSKLGFVEKMYMPEAQVAIVASPDDPDGTQLLLEPTDNPIAKNYMEGLYKKNIPVIIFGVKDLEAEYEKLKKRGVRFKKSLQRLNGDTMRFSRTPVAILFN